jgi:exoribonuclease-2
MHEHGVPGIYRCQGGGNGGWAARMQVRMLTHAAPHQGLGVDQYAWSTSPLRRYTDLVNQWQILACVEHGVAAPLAAPFKPKDADLFAIVSAFDAAYGAYADFQTNMERYWCLRWLDQQQAKRVEAVVLKEEVLRLVDIPLIIRLPGMPAAPRGSQVVLDLLRWDEVDLSVEARLVEVLQVQADAALAEEVLEEAVQDEPAEALIEAEADAEMTTAEGDPAVAATPDSVAAATEPAPPADNR